MSGNNRRASPSTPKGLAIPDRPFRRKPPVPCPPVGDRARSWWSVWATSPTAWLFEPTDWQDLADTTLVMDAFYETDNVNLLKEVRQHTATLFGVANRARLDITKDSDESGTVAPIRRERIDPRLRSVG